MLLYTKNTLLHTAFSVILSDKELNRIIYQVGNPTRENIMQTRKGKEIKKNKRFRSGPEVSTQRAKN